jgi:crotonobetainyl-CoA:carnitine CoA-transferase CaiB-like acyl-CoA transferase
VEYFRPGVMERLGYGWEELSSRYRRLVYASISGYGDSGPLRDQPAYDMIIQVASGAMSLWSFWLGAAQQSIRSLTRHLVTVTGRTIRRQT